MPLKPRGDFALPKYVLVGALLMATIAVALISGPPRAVPILRETTIAKNNLGMEHWAAGFRIGPSSQPDRIAQ